MIVQVLNMFLVNIYYKCQNSKCNYNTLLNKKNKNNITKEIQQCLKGLNHR
jgi:hypothetical protein